jgi:hypothetical protein
MTRKRVRTFFAVSIELGRNVKHRIAVRLQGELKKGWTPCSESLEIEAGKEPKGAVRQRQRSIRICHGTTTVKKCKH